jgi:formate dehydrogenase subunit gamma
VARPEHEGRIRRFSTAERMVHLATGCLMLLCLVTAACLYLGPVAQLVGRRHLMVTVHEWSGISLPLPSLLGLFSPAFRADLRRINRLAVYDRQWLRAVHRRVFTGLLMWFMGLVPFISRTSAIFVHDILAWAITVVVLGHIRKAFENPEAQLGMRTGYVSRSWAERHHSRWLREDM